MRAVLALLALLLIVPPAQAQQAQPTGAVIDILDVGAPPQTAAGKAFELNVTLVNRATTDRNVTLFAGLYSTRSSSDSPCGAATSTRFRNFTHLYQPVFRIKAGETLVYPHPGNTAWKQLYFANDVPEKPATYELCVFAAESEQGQQIDYFDYHSLALPVRAGNVPPRGDFTFTPTAPTATELVKFKASGTDADGDALTYRWDFGYLNASGRVRADGASASHAFYPPNEYTVTLAISDGLEETLVSHTFTVAQETAPTPAPVTPTTQEHNTRTPAPPLAVVLLALFAVAAVLTRRR